MNFEERYNQLCEKLGCKKYYITEINDGDLDSNYRLHAYTSVRECYQDCWWDIDETELTFKNWYKTNVLSDKATVEYRYPTFTQEKAFKIIQALISVGCNISIEPTPLDEYCLYVDMDTDYSDYHYSLTASMLEETLIEFILEISSKDMNNKLVHKVKDILDNMNIEEEQYIMDRKWREEIKADYEKIM